MSPEDEDTRPAKLGYDSEYLECYQNGRADGLSHTQATYDALDDLKKRKRIKADMDIGWFEGGAVQQANFMDIHGTCYYSFNEAHVTPEDRCALNHTFDFLIGLCREERQVQYICLLVRKEGLEYLLNETNHNFLTQTIGDAEVPIWKDDFSRYIGKYIKKGGRNGKQAIEDFRQQLKVKLGR